MAALPTPEALTLAANVFHADVDAWLPASFGVARSAAEKEAEWAAARSSGALRGADRLGLGHPDTEDPEARRAAQVSRAGGDILRRALKRKGDEPVVTPAAAREDDDGESRSRAVSSKKRKTADAFGKGRKEAAVHPLLNLKNPIPGYDAPTEPKKAVAVKTARAAEDDSVNAAAALAASLSTGSATMRVVKGASASPKRRTSFSLSAPSSPKAKIGSAPSSPKAKLGSAPGSPSAKTSTPSVAGSVPASEMGSSEASRAEPKSRAAQRREKRKAAKARKAL